MIALIAEPDSIESVSGLGEDGLATDHIQSSSLPRVYRTNASRRLSGRLPDRPQPSLHSNPSLSSIGSVHASELSNSGRRDFNHESHRPSKQPQSASQIISQVAEWLRQEKSKQARRRKHKTHAKLSHAAHATSALVDHFRADEAKRHGRHHSRSDSESSDSGLALEKLDQILSETINLQIDDQSKGVLVEEKRDSYFPAVHRRCTRKSSKLAIRRGSTVIASDTEHRDNELLVPSAEVILDNTKTLGYGGGAAGSELDLADSGSRLAKEKEAWKHFKNSIVTLTHTLKIQGWRKVPIETSGDIDVERLCGALTNAVYVVSPPKNLPQTPAVGYESSVSLVPKRPPP